MNLTYFHEIDCDLRSSINTKNKPKKKRPQRVADYG